MLLKILCYDILCALIDSELILYSDPVYSYTYFVFLNSFFCFIIYFLLMTKGEVVDSI